MYIADFHIHSKYSMATSKQCDIPHLDLWARYKGINLVGTGDFTHPLWRNELKKTLAISDSGFYKIKGCPLNADVKSDKQVQTQFVVSGEISCVYKKNGKTRKVHNLILLPNIEAADKLSEKLEKIGSVSSDGRPILHLDSRDLLEMTLDTSSEAIFIPAHIWTPHFSLFGAFSDFNSVEECFGDLTPHIHALETGLSSDPEMNRKISALDRFNLVSNSDAHSPAKLGREANVISGKMNYTSFKKAIETGENFDRTIEFFPEEGKYHLDGHRSCNFVCTPKETEKLGGKCPACGRKITVGVLNRTAHFTDRTDAKLSKPFEKLVPLAEIISQAMGVSENSKKVTGTYFELLHKLGNEFYILRNAKIAEIQSVCGEKIAQAIDRMRNGKVACHCGYDGEYGKVCLFD